MPSKRRRRFHSVSNELVVKSREAALAAVQIFNSPMLTFKSELFIVLMTIAWTYLLHAYFRKKGLEYRYFTQPGGRRIFNKTARGAYKHWELAKCLEPAHSPIDENTANNLRFLIGIRHEIEHQMTTKIDSTLSTKFQACCLNFNQYVKSLFGDAHGIDRHLTLSLQFSSISPEQAESLPPSDSMPAHISSYISSFQSSLSAEQFNDPRYAYRVCFVLKTAGSVSQADKVIEFIKPGSPLAEGINKELVLLQDREKPKMLARSIVATMRAEGFLGFNATSHTKLWQSREAKVNGKGFGTNVEGVWYWYDSWLTEVRRHCQESGDRYR